MGSARVGRGRSFSTICAYFYRLGQNGFTVKEIIRHPWVCAEEGTARVRDGRGIGGKKLTQSGGTGWTPCAVQI